MTRIVLAALCLVAVVMVPAGCGIVGAPISVPAAVVLNGNMDMTFAVMGPDGRPMTGVVLEQELNHLFWTPIRGGAITHEHKNLQVADRVTVHERGELLSLKFTHPDYFDTHYWINGTEPQTVNSDLGRWRYAENFPVVMVSRSASDVPLRLWQGTVNYADFPNQRILELPKLWAAGTTTSPNNSDKPISAGMFSPAGSTNTFSPPQSPANVGRGFLPPNNGRGSGVVIATEFNVTRAADMGPGCLYATLTTQTPRAINARGEVDPLEVNLPSSLTLHVSGADGGFVRMEPRLGFAPIFTADAAPTTGYVPELTISGTRLKEMRTAELDRIVEAYEYFFIKAAGHYGKGFVAWSMRYDPKTKAPTPMAFRYGFWMQPVAEEANLTWHRGIAK